MADNQEDCELHDDSIAYNPKGHVTNAHRQAGQLTRAGVRTITAEAVELKGIVYKICKSLGDVTDDKEQAEQLRATAQAAVAAVKAWDQLCDRIRIQQGKPLPGSLKPEAKPKPQRKQPAKHDYSEDLPANVTQIKSAS